MPACFSEEFSQHTQYFTPNTKKSCQLLETCLKTSFISNYGLKLKETILPFREVPTKTFFVCLPVCTGKKSYGA